MKSARAGVSSSPSLACCPTAFSIGTESVCLGFRTGGKAMKKLERLQPLPIDWKMKDVTSAKTEIEDLPDGRREVRIAHSLIEGVTPAMLVWWFRNFHRTMEYRGETIPRYRLWHPRDHISVSLLKPGKPGDTEISEGAVIEISEAIDKPARVVSTVAQLDETRFNLHLLVKGIKLVDHSHNFTATSAGTLDNARTIIDPTAPIFDEEKIKAYFKHGIEEVGNFQYFLPAIYEQRNNETLRL